MTRLVSDRIDVNRAHQLAIKGQDITYASADFYLEMFIEENSGTSLR